MKVLKMLSVMIGIGLLGAVLWVVQKNYVRNSWDERIAELCLTEGGLQIYEKVQISGDYFDEKGGFRGVYAIGGLAESERKGTEYYEISTYETLNEWDPTVMKVTTKMYKREDGKILGRVVGYSRSGGDALAIDQQSGYSCAEVEGFNGKITNVFEIIR